VHRIGQFSKLGKVTVKALRHYEEEGLLAPAVVDRYSGYRYYETGQLPRLHEIVSLRQCGFSIAEIRQVLAGDHVDELLRERAALLEAESYEAAGRLAAFRSYVGSRRGDGSMDYSVIVKELPEVIVFCKRFIVASYDDYFREIPRIGEEVVAANPDLKCVTNPPYSFIEYHDGEYKESDIDVEYCEAVVDFGIDTGSITFKKIDRVPQAACVMHKGPYSGFREAYAALFKWIEENGYAAAGNPRESYIDGIWNTSDESQWLTEVQVPITKV
jgi:DNA-binding transcriptional MerR regulator